jgi:hypothetical protein
VITRDFSDADLRIVMAAPGMASLFSGICDHCGKAYRNPPCQKSDHYRTCIDLAIEADQLGLPFDDNKGRERRKPWISFGCQNPREQQAMISPNYRDRRHPYDGARPEWSGYCPVTSCACSCHLDEAPELTIKIDEEVI